MDHPPLYILRHGETEWNAAGRFQGGLDSPLTALGQRQAERQRLILQARDLSGFKAVTSPQGRARHTAGIALAGLADDIATDAALAEIGMGAWAGKTRAELAPFLDRCDIFDVYENAPGGEGFARLHDRCSGFLQRLQQPAVLVTHGITSRMLRVILQGRRPADVADVDGGQGIVYYVAKGKQTKLSIGA